MTASSPAPVVRIAGVDKTFGRGDRVVTKALEAIDLDIARGEFVSLIGPSGCGKSTLLRIVGDLTSPSTGTVQVNGKSAEQARRDRDYGMVFQAPVLFDWRTVEDNVKLPLEILGYDAARRTATGLTDLPYRSCPSRRMLPVARKLGTRSFIRFMVRRSVDLPQPDGPMMAVACRLAAVTLTSLTARYEP